LPEVEEICPRQDLTTDAQSINTSADHSIIENSFVGLLVEKKDALRVIQQIHSIPAHKVTPEEEGYSLHGVDAESRHEISMTDNNSFIG
jgi:hypothetical protein